jgi:hypothetical protein
VPPTPSYLTDRILPFAITAGGVGYSVPRPTAVITSTMEVDPQVPKRDATRLCGGMLVDIFLLRVVDANQRFDGFDHTLSVAHEVFVDILGT